MSSATTATCFNCDGTQTMILYPYVESMVHANLPPQNLSEAMGWIITNCVYCREDLYWGRG